MTGLISRYSKEEDQSIGNMFLLDDNGSVTHAWKSLELPWLNNQKNISCIPEGLYTGVLHRSPKFGLCIWIKDVPGRSEILIHIGNFNRDILGCVVIGMDILDIDGDGSIDVRDSGDAMDELLAAIEYEGLTQIPIRITSV
jgi:hypothetical protein